MRLIISDSTKLFLCTYYNLIKFNRNIQANNLLQYILKTNLSIFQDFTSLSIPLFSNSDTNSLREGTFMAKVLNNLEYLARVPSAVLARASKLTASGS